MLAIPDTTNAEQRLRDLRIELARCTQALAAKVLSPPQLFVWLLRTQEGLTQAEIARRLNITRGAVHFSLHGRKRHYVSGKPSRRVGGSIATLRLRAARDSKIAALLDEIRSTTRELESETGDDPRRSDFRHYRDWSDEHGHYRKRQGREAIGL